jgi:hypothetical protein
MEICIGVRGVGLHMIVLVLSDGQELGRAHWIHHFTLKEGFGVLAERYHHWGVQR